MLRQSKISISTRSPSPLEFCWLIKTSFSCIDAECKEGINLCKYYIFLSYNFITFSLRVFKFFHYYFNFLSLSLSHRSGWKGSQLFTWSNLPEQARLYQSTWLRIVSRQFSDISTKGDPTISLDNLFQCSVSHLHGKNIFPPISVHRFLPIASTYCLALPRRAWLHLDTLCSDTCRHH